MKTATIHKITLICMNVTEAHTFGIYISTLVYNVLIQLSEKLLFSIEEKLSDITVCSL